MMYVPSAGFLLYYGFLGQIFQFGKSDLGEVPYISCAFRLLLGAINPFSLNAKPSKPKTRIPKA